MEVIRNGKFQKYFECKVKIISSGLHFFYSTFNKGTSFYNLSTADFLNLAYFYLGFS